MDLKNIDFAQIMQTAEKLASEAEKSSDVGGMINKMADTVFDSLEKSGRAIDPSTKTQLKMLSKTMINQVVENVSETENSKIDLGEQKLPGKTNEFEEISDNEDVPELRPYVEDLKFNMPMTLEDIYVGKNKKLVVNRKRLDKSGKKVIDDKRKLEIPIVRGVRDGQEIRFNKEGNEKPGYESGDIVIKLTQTNHQTFERHGNTLYLVKNISLYESYAAGRGDIRIVVKHLDGTVMCFKVKDGLPLHTKDGSRKIKGGGMPIYGSNGEYGDMYIRFNVILPEKIEDLEVVEKYFPILPGNGDNLVYKDKAKQDKYGYKSDKFKEVLLEEVSEEDYKQLEYDEQYEDYESEYESESESGSEYYSESGSESESEYEQEDHKNLRRR
jgi:DnaJ-class molecular chaperone